MKAFSFILTSFGELDLTSHSSRGFLKLLVPWGRLLGTWMKLLIRTPTLKTFAVKKKSKMIFMLRAFYSINWVCEKYYSSYYFISSLIILESAVATSQPLPAWAISIWIRISCGKVNKRRSIVKWSRFPSSVILLFLYEDERLTAK